MVYQFHGVPEAILCCCQHGMCRSAASGELGETLMSMDGPELTFLGLISYTQVAAIMMTAKQCPGALISFVDQKLTYSDSPVHVVGTMKPRKVSLCAFGAKGAKLMVTTKMMRPGTLR